MSGPISLRNARSENAPVLRKNDAAWEPCPSIHRVRDGHPRINCPKAKSRRHWQKNPEITARRKDSWHIIIGAGMYFIALWHSIHFVVTPLFHLMQQALVSHIIILIFFLIRKIRISSVLCASSTRGFEFLHFFLLSWSISFWQFLRQCFRNSWRTFQLVFSGWIIFLFFFLRNQKD